MPNPLFVKYSITALALEALLMPLLAADMAAKTKTVLRRGRTPPRPRLPTGQEQ